MEFNDMQLELINHYKGNCCVLAGAGSGKTNSVTYRVKNLIENYNINPNNILCVTFTKKSQKDLQEKFGNLLPFTNKALNVETFHSLGYKIIRAKHGSHYGFVDNGWQRDKMISDIVANKMKLCKADQVNTAEIKRFLGIQKNKLLLPTDKLCFDRLELTYDEYEMKEIYKLYEEEKEFQNLLDFDDMMIKGYYILKENKSILESFQNKFEFINIDEFQDTSECNIKTLQLLGVQGNVMGVGDIRQSIYNFRGSDNKYMLYFEEYFNNPKVINLNINYRSTENIVDYSNKVANTLNESKNVNYKDSIAFRDRVTDVEFNLYPNEKTEAKAIASKIREIMVRNECDLDDIMVMARTNAQLQNMEMALYDNSLSFVGDNGSSFIKRTEIKLILSYLKLASNIEDNESFKYCFSKPLRWLSLQFFSECQEYAKKNNISSLFLAMDVIGRRGWRFKSGIDELQNTVRLINKIDCDKETKVSDIIIGLRKFLNLDAYLCKDTVNNDSANNEIIESMDNLVSIAKEYNTLSEFLDYIKGLEEKVEETKIGVNLSTIHRAKGLEKKVCFVIGVSDGLLPHAKCEDVNEEKRVYYVGISRAMDELYVSAINYYQGRQVGASQFLNGIEFNNVVKCNQQVN